MVIVSLVEKSSPNISLTIAWLVCVDKLAGAAELQPQFEWSFVQQIMPDCESSFAILQDIG